LHDEPAEQHNFDNDEQYNFDNTAAQHPHDEPAEQYN